MVGDGLRVPFLDLGRAHRPMHEELAGAFAGVLRGGDFILGEQVERFEQEFAEYCGVAHCVGVGSGLDALHLILRALDVGPGDEVLVPSNTYIATWLAVSHAGATPVPVEPDPATFNVDPARVEAAITDRTRALIVVHLYGRPASMDRLAAVAKERGLLLVEDAAQAHGARHGGARCGALGVGAGFSFYPTKNLGALGDGGAVTTDDGVLAERVRELRSYGGLRRGEHRVAGMNSRLDELQAALLRVKLRRLDADNARRRTIATRYLSELAEATLTLPRSPAGAEDAWHLFVVRSPRRDALRTQLARAGIETMVHYPVSPHLQPAYSGLGLGRGDLPIAERLQDEVLSLPLSPAMPDDEVDAVIRACRAFA